MNDVKEVAGLIRELAKQKGTTVNKMLLSCGLGKSLISDMEAREAYPTVDKLAKISDHLEVTMDYLIKKDGPNPQFTKSERNRAIMGADKANEIRTAVNEYFKELGKRELKPNIDIGLTAERISAIRNNKVHPKHVEFWYMLNVLDPKFKGGMIPDICHQVLGILYEQEQEQGRSLVERFNMLSEDSKSVVQAVISGEENNSEIKNEIGNDELAAEIKTFLESGNKLPMGARRTILSLLHSPQHE